MANSPHNVERWLTAARAGSQEALGELLQACRRYLLWVARRELDPCLLPKGGASDIVQETFLDAQKSFHQFHGQSEAEVLAWLRRVLLNNLANFSRRYRDTAKRQLDSEISLDAKRACGDGPWDINARSSTPSRILMKREQLDVAQRALARLPEDYRQVITLWQEENRTFQEIGQLMSRSPNAARMLWVRAIERLQRELESEA